MERRDRTQTSTPPEQANALLSSAIFLNSFRPASPWFGSTGLRTSPLRYAAIPAASSARIAEEFLINSRFSRAQVEMTASVQTYFQDPHLTLVSRIGDRAPTALGRFPLPEGVRLRMDLGEALRRRRSQREFTGDPISFDYLATVLRAAAGVSGIATTELAGGGGVDLRFHTAPSGGGLYPIELLVAAIKVNGLDEGVYLYAPNEDALHGWAGADTQRRLLDTFLLPESFINLRNLGAIVFLVARPWRSMRKYGNRGMRYLLHEGGAIAQNIHLAATALGIGTVDFAGFFDDEVNRELGIDGQFQAVVHSIMVGTI